MKKKEFIGMVSAYDISLDLALDAKEPLSWVKQLFKVGRKKRDEKKGRKKPEEKKI